MQPKSPKTNFSIKFRSSQSKPNWNKNEMKEKISFFKKKENKDGNHLYISSEFELMNSNWK